MRHYSVMVVFILIKIWRFKMEIRHLTREQAKQLVIPEYQRKIDQAHKRSMLQCIIDKNDFCFMPITINKHNEVVDGQHRLMAYIDSGIETTIPAICYEDSNKDTFLAMNKGKTVAVAHKILIHEKMKLLKNITKITTGSSTKDSISASDLGRAVVLLKTGAIVQARQQVIFYILDNISSDEFLVLAQKALYVKNKYFDNLPINKKFLQKLYLFIVHTSSKIDLSDADFYRIIDRFPNSLGGDISLTINKQFFIDAYNYKKRSGKIDLDFLQTQQSIKEFNV